MGWREHDARTLVASLRRTVSGAPIHVAERLAQTVRSVSPARLDQLMRTPARRLVLGGIFWQMPQFLDRRRSVGLNSSLRWVITGRPDGGTDVYDLVFSDGRGRVIKGGEEPPPRVTITVDGVEFLPSGHRRRHHGRRQAGVSDADPWCARLWSHNRLTAGVSASAS